MSAFRHPPLSHSRATRQLQPVTRHVLVGFHAPQRLPQRGSSTTCQFWGGLTQLFGGEERQQDQALSLYSLVEEELDSSHPAQPHNHDRMYSSLLQQAEEITFNSAAPQTDPAGTSAGGALLEDAERMLELCIQQRPQHLQPRVLLLRNLMRQGGARERDVPSLAIQALQEADLPRSDVSMMRHLHALQIVTLGVKALHKLHEEGAATHTVKSFLAAAQAAAPSYGADFEHQALRVHRQLMCCSPEQRLSMLYDTNGYMSSVDLSAVCGAHHHQQAAGTAREGAGMPDGPAWA